MSEIAKCPICGEDPVVLDHYGGGYEKSYICCNVEVHGLSLWNKYAAAMKLAKAEVAVSNAVLSVPLERLEPAVEATEDMLFQAKMRVLEVFK